MFLAGGGIRGGQILGSSDALGELPKDDAITPSDLAATILEPFVSEKNHWIVKQHAIFQGYYFFHHLGLDRDMRDRFRDHEWFRDCAEFCEKYDQNCFDADYDTLPLEFFEPMVRRVLARGPARAA